MKIDRRNFLGYLGVILASPACLSAASLVDGKNTYYSEELQRLRDSLFSNVSRKDLNAIYNISEEKILSSLKLLQKSSNHVSKAIRDDFKRNKTCSIDGWILSQTEVILCTMI
jgi:hypothetical protein